MINKYKIDLRQFNNGESEQITFPTYDQCAMYGLHKLKMAFEHGVAVTEIVVIEDSFGRNIVIHPNEGEVKSLHSLHHGRASSPDKIEFRLDPIDGKVFYNF